MLEILKYTLGGFWRFVGFIMILSITLHYACNAIVLITKYLMRNENSNTMERKI